MLLCNWNCTTANDDYDEVDRSFVLSGSTGKQRICDPSHLDDDFTEEDETFVINLHSNSSAVFLENSSIMVTILYAQGNLPFLLDNVRHLSDEMYGFILSFHYYL